MKRDNNYTVLLHRFDGTSFSVDEWFTLPQAKKLAAISYDSRVKLTNSDVAAIEIVDIEGNSIQIARFD